MFVLCITVFTYAQKKTIANNSACPYVMDTQTCETTEPGKLHCSGVKAMVIPEGGGHVRSVEIRTPLISHLSEIELNICSTTNKKNIFKVYSIKSNQLGSETQIAIEADNAKTGVSVPEKFICTYEIWGEF